METIVNPKLKSEIEVQIANYLTYAWGEFPKNTSYPWFIEMAMKRMTFIKRVLYNSTLDCFVVELKDYPPTAEAKEVPLNHCPNCGFFLERT